MNKLTTFAVAGVLAASTLAVATTSADAGRWKGPRHHHGPVYGGPVYGPGPHYSDGGALAAGAIFGLVAGAIASQAFAPAPYYYPPAYPVAPPPTYYPPVQYQPVYPVYADAHAQWCAQQYRSYNVQTDTWVDYSGVVRQCIGPY